MLMQTLIGHDFLTAFAQLPTAKPQLMQNILIHADGRPFLKRMWGLKGVLTETLSGGL